MLRRLNDALPGLTAGIVLWGVLLQAVGVWFVPDKAAYSIGLWYGVAIAVGMAINMASVIYDSTFEDTGGKTNYRVVIKSILRYIVVVVLYAILGIFGFGNILAAFCGTMGLKVSAYIQPLFMKLEVRLGLREPEPEWTEETEADPLEIQDSCEEKAVSDINVRKNSSQGDSDGQAIYAAESDVSEKRINMQEAGSAISTINREVEA